MDISDELFLLKKKTTYEKSKIIETFVFQVEIEHLYTFCSKITQKKAMKAPTLLIGIILLVLNQLAAQFSDIEATELALRRVANIRNAQQSNNRYANAQGSAFFVRRLEERALIAQGAG